MVIENHLLKNTDFYSVDHLETPNMGGDLRSCLYIVHHYTAGNHESDGSLNWMMNADAGVSAHLFIPRDGSLVTQLAPFNKTAWHAGESKYNGLKWLNNWSVGIEISNPGALDPIGNGQYKTAYGDILSDDVYDIIEAPMPHRGDVPHKGWLKYTDFQKKAVFDITRQLRHAYNDTLCDVVGHSDISPGRKIDPGPAWDLASIRKEVFPEYTKLGNGRVTANLNMRTGMSTDYRVITTIPEDTHVDILGSFSSGWLRVKYTHHEGAPEKGFVFGSYVNWL